MTIVESIIKICDWLNEEVCPSFKFKKEPEVGKPINDAWEYERVSPHAFPLFLPTMDKLPPNVSTNMPSVCVQIVDGSDAVPKGSRDINIQLGISVWNPGIHSKDIYYPKGAVPEEREKYRSSYDGWMDLWNFIDFTIRKIESISGIEGLFLAQNVPVRFGTYNDQEAGSDHYPHWLGYIQFTMRSEFVRNNEDVEKYL